MDVTKAKTNSGKDTLWMVIILAAVGIDMAIDVATDMNAHMANKMTKSLNDVPYVLLIVKCCCLLFRIVVDKNDAYGILYVFIVMFNE